MVVVENLKPGINDEALDDSNTCGCVPMRTRHLVVECDRGRGECRSNLPDGANAIAPSRNGAGTAG